MKQWAKEKRRVITGNQVIQKPNRPESQTKTDEDEKKTNLQQKALNGK